MFFSCEYTSFNIIPHVAQPGRAQEFTLELTINVALDMDWNMTGQVTANRIITDALNRHAGGRRIFNHTPVFVRWSLSWSLSGVHSGRKLLVAFVPRETLSKIHAGGYFARVPEKGRTIALVLLPAEGLTQAAQRHPDPRIIDAFRSTAAHEFGHAVGAKDDMKNMRSIMYYRELSRHEMRYIHQTWSDNELRDALQNLFSPQDLPPWLHSALSR